MPVADTGVRGPLSFAGVETMTVRVLVLVRPEIVKRLGKLTPRIASLKNVTEAVVRRALMDGMAHGDLPNLAGRREGAARPQFYQDRRRTFGPRQRRWLWRR